MPPPPPSQPISWKAHKHACTPTSPPHTNKPTHSSIHMHTQTLRPTWKKDIPRATPPIGPMLPLMKSTTRLWQPWNSYYTSRILYTFFTSIMNNILFSTSRQDKQSAFSFLKKNKNCSGCEAANKTAATQEDFSEGNQLTSLLPFIMKVQGVKFLEVFSLFFFLSLFILPLLFFHHYFPLVFILTMLISNTITTSLLQWTNSMLVVICSFILWHAKILPPSLPYSWTNMMFYENHHYFLP